ncbi:MAG TPA: RNase adapter RapZ [Hyphomicrobiales bacterium]|nr:RNase adapter RapZ [Hyphomicrobiales bacterium]
MKLIIVSGRSGSGKTTCLHVLEDIGYYCVDNIPASLLSALAQRLSDDSVQLTEVAVSIDARNLYEDLEQFPQIYQSLRATAIDAQIIFLDADDNTLLKRFSETRRKHPLSTDELSLFEAIAYERTLLEPLATEADLTIDTSTLSLHQLRDIIKNRVAEHDSKGIALQFLSFGFKNGVPVDADLVFDARCLPNPFWVDALRGHTGLETPVQEYLEQQPEVQEMLTDIRAFLDRWLPSYQSNNRSYITVAIGCTGGYHRSVYLCEKLGRHFLAAGYNAQVRHKDLP